MFDRFSKERCYFIAEIGGNFTSYDEAVALIDAAKIAGVDCIKVQTFTAETISIKGAFFDMESTGKISQFDYFKKYELSKEMHVKISQYILDQGLDWFSTPSHQEDVDLLVSLKVPAIKVGADDASNIPLLKYIARTGLPIVLSTGMCTLAEVKEAVEAIEEEGNDKIAVLHTVSGYPTHAEHVNLNIIDTYKREFPKMIIGFSDHTITTMASIAAATIGANIIERHFTLDKEADGPDHQISSTPDEMKHIIDSIREIEKMKGSSIKKPYGAEVANRINNRKSVVAIQDIKAGDVLTESNIGIKRPGTGIEPKEFHKLLGKTATKSLQEDDLLTRDDF